MDVPLLSSSSEQNEGCRDNNTNNSPSFGKALAGMPGGVGSAPAASMGKGTKGGDRNKLQLVYQLAKEINVSPKSLLEELEKSSASRLEEGPATEDGTNTVELTPAARSPVLSRPDVPGQPQDSRTVNAVSANSNMSGSGSRSHSNQRGATPPPAAISSGLSSRPASPLRVGGPARLSTSEQVLAQHVFGRARPVLLNNEPQGCRRASHATPTIGSKAGSDPDAPSPDSCRGDAAVRPTTNRLASTTTNMIKVLFSNIQLGEGGTREETGRTININEVILLDDIKSLRLGASGHSPPTADADTDDNPSCDDSEEDSEEGAGNEEARESVDTRLLHSIYQSLNDSGGFESMMNKITSASTSPCNSPYVSRTSSKVPGSNDSADGNPEPAGAESSNNGTSTASAMSISPSGSLRNFNRSATIRIEDIRTGGFSQGTDNHSDNGKALEKSAEPQTTASSAASRESGDGEGISGSKVITTLEHTLKRGVQFAPNVISHVVVYEIGDEVYLGVELRRSWIGWVLLAAMITAKFVSHIYGVAVYQGLRCEDDKNNTLTPRGYFIGLRPLDCDAPVVPLIHYWEALLQLIIVLSFIIAQYALLSFLACYRRLRGTGATGTDSTRSKEKNRAARNDIAPLRSPSAGDPDANRTGVSGPSLPRHPLFGGHKDYDNDIDYENYESDAMNRAGRFGPFSSIYYLYRTNPLRIVLLLVMVTSLVLAYIFEVVSIQQTQSLYHFTSSLHCVWIIIFRAWAKSAVFPIEIIAVLLAIIGYALGNGIGWNVQFWFGNALQLVGSVLFATFFLLFDKVAQWASITAMTIVHATAATFLSLALVAAYGGGPYLIALFDLGENPLMSLHLLLVASLALIDYCLMLIAVRYLDVMAFAAVFLLRSSLVPPLSYYVLIWIGSSTIFYQEVQLTALTYAGYAIAILAALALIIFSSHRRKFVTRRLGFTRRRAPNPYTKRQRRLAKEYRLIINEIMCKARAEGRSVDREAVMNFVLNAAMQQANQAASSPTGRNRDVLSLLLSPQSERAIQANAEKHSIN